MSDNKYTHGMFVWRELYTPDIEASKRFYGELAGWSLKKAPMPGMDYWLATVGDRQVGGLFQPKEGPAHWNCYVSVPDADAAANAAKTAGGTVLNGPLDIPGVGRMATIRDPQGAMLSVLKNLTGDSPAGRMPVAGEFCWEQINTTDLAAAKEFYAKVVGWKVLSYNGMEMFGPAEGQGAASFMTTPPGVPSHWLTFIAVPKLTDANTRAVKLGGKVMMDSIAVPTVGTFSVVQDNVGATVSFFESLPQAPKA